MSSAENMAAPGVSSRRPLDDASREWLRCLAGAESNLRGAGEREQALARLHDVLLGVARAELRRRDPVYIDGPEHDDLALQAADDALRAITGKLDQFRGESRFTTWACKFVILEVSARLARRYRRDPPVHASDDGWERIPDRFGADPADRAGSRDLVEALRRAASEALSERQRRVFIAVVVEGVPLDALAVQLGSTCDAIYKTMFDARRKIRAHLVSHGYLADE